MKVSNHRKVASTPKTQHQTAGAAKKGGGKKGSGDGFDGIKSDMTEAQMLKKQQEMQKEAEKWQMLSNLLQMQHDMKKSILSNFRV
jgi:hypothetical protein